MSRVCLVAGLMMCVAGCKQGAAAGGTIVLQLESTTPVDRVQLRLFDPKGNKSEFTFDTAGRDLTKNKAIGEITPGTAIAGGKVLIVGEGYYATAPAPVGSGRAEAEFQPNQRVTVTLTLKADIVDQDMDGFAKQEDCDDQNAMRNSFFQEICGNNIDDDCDGTADNGCPCVNGVVRACYNQADGSTRGIGDCHDGTQTCTAGLWGLCQGSVGPVAETCNGKDEDCDGTVDESCPCTPATQRFCNGRKVSSTTGSEADLMLVGECKAGVQQCVGSAWGDCAGATLAVAEACNGKDDDCDGIFDNGFDADGDGFTTCGTVNGVCARPPVGGTASDLIDCDDSNPARHPCQADKCGDGNFDDDCSGSGNECTVAAGACSDAGYYAGWQAAGGRGRSECRRAGNTYGTECDPATLLCKTAVVQCVASPGIGSLVAATRAVCTDVNGCDSGTTNAPGVSGPIVNADPYNDCDIIACDGHTGGQVIYAGRAAHVDTGWRINGAAFECRTFPDVPAAITRCASGACESPVAACQRAYPNGASGTVTALSISSPCQIPLGYSSFVDFGPTCVTPTGAVGSSAPASAFVNNGTDDPLGRCPGNAAACVGTVHGTGWTGTPTASCDTIGATVSGTPQLTCSGGACSGTLDYNTCVPGSSVAKQCNVNCKIDAACTRGPGPAGGHFCYDLTAPSGIKGGSCPTNQTCEGANESAATCLECSYDLACGAGCNACTGGALCGVGITGGGAVVASNPGVTLASGSVCMCGAPGSGDNTVGIPCNNSCCAEGLACVTGVCTAPTGGRVACAPSGSLVGATCPSGSVCNVSNWPFACDLACPAAQACGQKCCGANERCADATKSQCVSCNLASACGNPAASCSAPGFNSIRTCLDTGTCATDQCAGTCGGTPVGNGVACAVGGTGPVAQCTTPLACGPSCAPCAGTCTGSTGFGKDYVCL